MEGKRERRGEKRQVKGGIGRKRTESAGSRIVVTRRGREGEERGEDWG